MDKLSPEVASALVGFPALRAKEPSLAKADIRVPQGSSSADDDAPRHHTPRRSYSAADEARFARKNRMHSAGGRALVIGLAWVRAEPSARGPLITELGKAFRQMLREGVEPPTASQIKNALEAVKSHTKQAAVGRSRKR